MSDCPGIFGVYRTGLLRGGHIISKLLCVGPARYNDLNFNLKLSQPAALGFNVEKKRRKKRFPRNINKPLSWSIFILPPRNLQKLIFQPNLHQKLTSNLFFQSRHPLNKRCAFFFFFFLMTAYSFIFLIAFVNISWKWHQRPVRLNTLRMPSWYTHRRQHDGKCQSQRPKFRSRK